MSHVVTRKCIGCKDTSCVTVCPCECFHEGPEMLYIDPELCIDCEACVVECPVQAIFQENDLPGKLEPDKSLNAAMVKIYPVILERRT